MNPLPPCGLAVVLAAARDGSALPAALVDALPTRGETRPPPSGGTGKAVYGERLDHHLDTVNFTVAWSGTADLDDAALAAADALEDAWSALVVGDGWPRPTSADEWLLWVILDPDLEYTGFTVLVESEDYPDGYPVITLNPEYARYPEFWQGLAAHEFVHALQYGLRDEWSAVGEIDEETWYWEASAEWGAARALPDVDAYADQSVGYTEHPERRYTSLEDGHDYGMFLLNAYLEQRVAGDAFLLDTWLLGGERPGVAWDAILAEATGEAVSDLWGGFTAATANGQLDESWLYADVRTVSALLDGASGSLPYLGTHYYAVDSSVATVAVEGDVVLSSASGWGSALVASGGEVVGVTGLDPEEAGYTLGVQRWYRGSERPFGGGESGLCATGPGGPGAPLLGLGLVLWRRRRRPGPRSST